MHRQKSVHIKSMHRNAFYMHNLCICTAVCICVHTRVHISYAQLYARAYFHIFNYYMHTHIFITMHVHKIVHIMKILNIKHKQKYIIEEWKIYSHILGYIWFSFQSRMWTCDDTSIKKGGENSERSFIFFFLCLNYYSVSDVNPESKNLRVQNNYWIQISFLLCCEIIEWVLSIYGRSCSSKAQATVIKSYLHAMNNPCWEHWEQVNNLFLFSLDSMF